MAFYTPKTTAAKAILKVVILVHIVLILLIVRRNLCMTPQQLALRCMTASEGLNNMDPMEVCALLTFLTVLTGLAYSAESVLDIVVSAWDSQKTEKETTVAAAATTKTGIPIELIIGISAGVVALIIAGVAIAIYYNIKPDDELQRGLQKALGAEGKDIDKYVVKAADAGAAGAAGAAAAAAADLPSVPANPLVAPSN